MIIRPISDIHLEFGSFDLPVIEGESEQILCINGDLNPARCLYEVNLGTGRSTEAFFENIQDRFKDVLYISGNHEYYHGDVNTDDQLFKDICDIFGYTFLQNGEHKDIDDTRFIGATLWSDFENQDPHSMMCCGDAMNDFKIISDSAHEPNLNRFYYPGMKAPFVPSHALSRHYQHRTSIFNKLAETKGKKTVVMSHHAPSYQSISPSYRNSHVNGAYYSNLEPEILKHSPNL